MPRPTKIELLQRLFPELKQPSSKGEKEAAIRFNTLACEAILADWIRIHDLGFERDGRGVLCLRLHRDAKESSFLPLDVLQQDRDQARKDGADELVSFLDDAIRQIERTNPNKAVLVMLLDNSGAQVFAIDREHPAKAIESALEEFAQ